jgi:hypothetical protein
VLGVWLFRNATRLLRTSSGPVTASKEAGVGKALPEKVTVSDVHTFIVGMDVGEGKRSF